MSKAYKVIKRTVMFDKSNPKTVSTDPGSGSGSGSDTTDPGSSEDGGGYYE